MTISTETKQQIISDVIKSGQSIRSYCRDNNLTNSSVYNWFRQIHGEQALKDYNAKAKHKTPDPRQTSGEKELREDIKGMLSLALLESKSLEALQKRINLIKDSM